MKMKNTSALGWMAALLCALFILSGMSSKPAPFYENSLLWEISGNGISEPSYLFGTFHLLNQSYLETVPKVQRAFEEAEGVVVEVIIDSTEMSKSMGAMYMPDNSLKKMYKPKTYKKLSENFEEITGRSISMINQLKPNVAMLQMVGAFAQAATEERIHTDGAQLDMYFATEGKKAGKQVRSLETIGQQMDILMNSVSVEEQAEALEWVMNHMEEMEAGQSLLVSSYLAQDMDGLLSLLTDYPEANNKGLSMEALLDRRNDNWMEQLPALFEEGKQFVAVGALHLVGENGLINQLRSQGYTLSPVMN